MPSPGARIATAGLWHLGSVASACLASLGYSVRGTDPDPARVRDLAAGALPVLEPGFAALVTAQMAEGRLAAEGVEVTAFDPQVRNPQQETHGIRLCDDAATAATGADALVLLTPWPEFRALDWNRLRTLARCPLVVDAHNFLDDAAARRAGWRYRGLGIPGGQPERAAKAGAK
jgi:UDP-glucose 6-dehydrogenase